jgi:tetratricopeptide (TPR) repeat protein
MKTPLLLMLVVGVALAAGAGGGLLARGEPQRPDVEVADESVRLSRLLDRLESMRREQDALRQSLDALALSAAAASRPTSVSGADIDAAVGRYLDEQAVARLDSATPAAAGELAVAEGAPDPQALFGRLLDVALGPDERQALWDEARTAGVLDQLVALFEQRALDNPRDPEAQVDFGEACIQKIFEVGDGPAAGAWASKADQAYDAALALDERHWEARFSKAVALSFWPPIFGKQAEAIGQLQTLIEQQRDQPPQPKFVQAYLALGNLYLQSGKLEQAQGVFAAGLKLFPNDAELLAKLSP